MIVIYAEKADAANKMAAALGGFDLPGGTHISFKNLRANIVPVEAFQKSQGYLDIQFEGMPCKVTWGYGHQYRLADVAEYNSAYRSFRVRPECFIPEKFCLRAITSDIVGFDSKLSQQRKVTKELFLAADNIINVTDDDREGELIFAYIYEAIGCKKPYQRVRLSSWAERGIVDAFKHLLPSSAVQNIEMAGRARSIYDWLIGTNLTAQMTIKNPGNDVLSVGRVQTPVLKMLVDRELDIRKFKSEGFWTIEGIFTLDSGETYTGKYRIKRFEKKVDADTVMSELAINPGKVTEVKSTRSNRSIPLLYSLTALQMEANEKYGFTAEQVLNIVQKLYENGYTTYPRTKSQYLNDDMRPTVINVLHMLETMTAYSPYLSGMPKQPNDSFFDSAKVESHFAIIPTEEVPKGLSEEQRKVYDLIAKSVIRTIYPDAILENTVIITMVAGKHEFTTTGTVVADMGWLTVDTKVKETTLPKMNRGEVVSGKYDCKAGKTEPPKRYTDKTLLAAMKSAGRDLTDEELKRILSDPKVEGIGTEATRAAIITTLISRKYAERRGKQFFATEKGIELIAALPVNELKSAEFTARMEKELSAIASGSSTYAEFIKAIEAQTRRWCAEIAIGSHSAMSSAPVSGAGSTDLKCPLCGGDINKFEWGWGCSKYKTGCKFSIGKVICKKKITDTIVKRIIKKGTSGILPGFINKAGNEFPAELKIEGDKVSVVPAGRKAT